MLLDRALLHVKALEARKGWSSKDMKRNSWIWQLTCEQQALLLQSASNVFRSVINPNG